MSTPVLPESPAEPQLRDLSVETSPAARREQLYRNMQTLILAILITAACMLQVFPNTPFFLRLLLFAGTILTLRIIGGLIVFACFLGNVLVADPNLTGRLNAAGSMPETVLFIAGVLFLFEQRRNLQEFSRIPFFTELGKIRQQLSTRQLRDNLTNAFSSSDQDQQNRSNESEQWLQTASALLMQVFTVMLCCVAAVLLLLLIPRGGDLNSTLAETLQDDPQLRVSSLLLAALVGVMVIGSGLLNRLLSREEAALASRSEQLRTLFPDLMLIVRANLKRRKRRLRKNRGAD